jgi:hypothetical protein
MHTFIFFTGKELGDRDKKKKKLQGFYVLAFVCNLQSRAICDFIWRLLGVASLWHVTPCSLVDKEDPTASVFKP